MAVCSILEKTSSGGGSDRESGEDNGAGFCLSRARRRRFVGGIGSNPSPFCSWGG